MRLLRLHLAFCVLVLVTGAALAQEKRIALLIGNQAYDASVGALKNPHNDVALVAEGLKKQGFEILPLVKDARRNVILAAVRELAGKLRAAGPGAVGFLYYSGHGAAEKDTNVNYLIPVDAKDPGSASFWDDSVKLDDVTKLLDQARGAVKFVVFDACRNELQLPTRDTTKGLVPVAEQQGFFVAYASAPGRTASDAGARSGPYAAALAVELGRQGLDHLNLFQNVKETVIAATGGSQHPWESNGLTRRVYLTGEPTMPADMALWESVRTTSDIPSLQRYLERFPKGVFAATAQQMIERLQTEVAQRQAAQQFEVERKAQEAKLSDELRKALDEAKAAREAIAAAETRRAAAEAAARSSGAQKTPNTSEARVSQDALAEADARFKAAEQRLAALEQPKPAGTGQSAQPAQPGSGPFGGAWRLEFASNNRCTTRNSTNIAHWRIDNGVVHARGGQGMVSSAGEVKIQWPNPLRAELTQTMTVKLVGDSGKGTWLANAGEPSGCGGGVTWTRVVAVEAAPQTATMPAVVKPSPQAPFDGAWQASFTSQTCANKAFNMLLTVENNQFSVVMGQGQASVAVSSNGSTKWTLPAGTDGAPVNYELRFGDNDATGRYRRADGGCSGSITAKRNP